MGKKMTSYNKTLTIGIPTYNRYETIDKHIKKILKEKVVEKCNILIIDGSSPDGTYEKIKKYDNGNTLRIIGNKKREGFAVDFTKLFFECKTEYILVTSDEIPIITGKIESLMEFLLKNEPLFVSPQTYAPDSHYTKKPRRFRGRLISKRIKPREFKEASSRFHGLVFKVKESKTALKKTDHYIKEKSLYGYQTMILAMELLTKGLCYWWNGFIVKQEFFCEDSWGFQKGILVPYLFRSRWEQYESIIKFLEEKIDNAEDNYEKKTSKRMLKTYAQSLFDYLRSAIGREHPKHLKNFDRGVFKYYILKRYIKIQGLIRQIFLQTILRK
jgi:glycosyltransferase involved in cell wall biosynthesis